MFHVSLAPSSRSFQRGPPPSFKTGNSKISLFDGRRFFDLPKLHSTVDASFGCGTGGQPRAEEHDSSGRVAVNSNRCAHTFGPFPSGAGRTYISDGSRGVRDTGDDLYNVVGPKSTALFISVGIENFYRVKNSCCPERDDCALN